MPKRSLTFDASLLAEKRRLLRRLKQTRLRIAEIDEVLTLRGFRRVEAVQRSVRSARRAAAIQSRRAQSAPPSAPNAPGTREEGQNRSQVAQEADRPSAGRKTAFTGTSVFGPPPPPRYVPPQPPEPPPPAEEPRPIRVVIGGAVFTARDQAHLRQLLEEYG